jgi:acetolactate synthase I/II/III large subunit
MAAGAMTGAESVLRTLSAGGVKTCFANPGTSEMHLVAALDRVPEVRPVLALFEGVASGAADGYGRMAEVPAATLLHLGPGLGNAFANLHNAYKARTPMVNVVGDHAVAHAPLNAPLASDIASVARPVSHWYASARDARSAATDAAAALAAARGHGGGIATLVVPADAGWEASAGPAAPLPVAPAAPVPQDAVEAAARALRGGGPAALLIGGTATRGPGLRAAARIAAATGARLIHDTFPARLERGAGIPRAQPLPYLTEMATEALAGLDHLVICGTQAPVAFFAYPGRPSRLAAPGTAIEVLAGPREDVAGALEALADALGVPPGAAPGADAARPEIPDGALDAAAIGAAIAALLPDGAIVVDESVTASAPILAATAGAAPHDWLTLTGGAIGQGLPAATGAAVACPDRPVLSLEGDGSAMYTIQALWTQAREGLDVTTVILANRSYAILDFELSRVGAADAAGGRAARGGADAPHGRGAAAEALFGIGRPDLDFVGLAAGMGVPGVRVDDAQGFAAALREALAEPGPRLIEARV